MRKEKRFETRVWREKIMEEKETSRNRKGQETVKEVVEGIRWQRMKYYSNRQTDDRLERGHFTA